MKQILLAFFDSVEQANDAVRDLVQHGYNRSDIGLAVNDVNNRYSPYLSDGDVKADEGAGFGALVGGLTGVVAGLTAIIIPGIGPAIAAGPLAAALSGLTGAAIGAASGAATGGLTAGLVDMGVSEEHSHHYAEGLRRGGALVSVTLDDSQISDAISLLRRHDPVDVEQRAYQWKKNEGWTGFDPSADPYTAPENAGVTGTSTVEDSETVTYDTAHTDYQTEDRRVRMYPSMRD